MIGVYEGSVFDLPVEKVYAASALLSPPLSSSTTEYLSLFAQDSWDVTPRLNLRSDAREEQRIKVRSDRLRGRDPQDNWAPTLGPLRLPRRRKVEGVSALRTLLREDPERSGGACAHPSSSVFSLFYDAGLTRPIPGQEQLFESEPFEIEGLGRSTSPYTARSQYTDEWVAGVEQEVGSGFSLGARLIFRTVERVLEDIQVNLDLPCVPNYLGGEQCVPPGMTTEAFLTSNGSYFITNVDGHYPGYPKLEREYRALELTAQRRYAGGWQVLGSYRYARLEGNYEGLFRRDNGQSGPNITSLADLAESPWIAYTFDKGPLPNDVEHAVKLFGSYHWDLGWSAGMAFNDASGRPITELGAIPYYDSQERLLSPRGARGRLGSITTLDLRAEYDLRLGGAQTIALGVDVFNALDARAATSVVENSEIDNLTFEPDPNADFLQPAAYQTPRSIRFVVKYSF